MGVASEGVTVGKEDPGVVGRGVAVGTVVAAVVGALVGIGVGFSTAEEGLFPQEMTEPASTKAAARVASRGLAFLM